MPKILVLGNSGAGKSTFATKVAEKLNIPHLHLDTIAYKRNWKYHEFNKVTEQIYKFMENESWIIDGNYLCKAMKRFDECDTIYFLDIDRKTCLHSVINRYRKFKGKPRKSRPVTCDEKLTLAYLSWVYSRFYKESRPQIIDILENTKAKVYVFHNREEVNNYLKEL